MKQTLCFSSGRSAMCLTLLVLTQSSLLVVIQANNEGDALHSFRRGVQDPSGVLQSWDPSLVNPCTWFHVTCDQADRVIRVDLGNSMLSGFISPALGNLSKLRYLELYSNNFSGIIPETLGNLTELVSLDLYLNTLTGSIPSSLGNLLSLETLRLNNNSLTGDIPMSLTTIEDLQVLDLSSNQLYGEVPSNGSFSLFTPLSFADNPGLCGKIVGKQCPGGPPIPAPAPAPAPFEDNGNASSPTSGADD